MGCKTIGIMSFKGGVGKSVSTINLASALAKLGNNVLVIDGNFLSPNLHFYLGLLDSVDTLKDVIEKGIKIENAVYEHKSGLHLMPCSFYKNIDFNKFKKVVDELRERYDYIIVDSGPSYTEEVIAVLMVCDSLIFITTPDYPTLASTVKASKFMKFKDVEVLGVVVNRRRGRRFELKVKDIERTSKLKVIAAINEDSKMMMAVKAFSPVVWKYPWSSSSRRFMKLAKKISN